MARIFDAAATKVETTVAALDSGDWTIAAWVFANSAGEASLGTLAIIRDGGGSGLQVVRIAAAGRTVRAFQIGATLGDSTSTTTLNTGQWYALIASLRASDGKTRIYYGDQTTPIAEMAYASQTALVTRTTGATTLTVGTNAATTTTWDGSIAHLIADGREWSLADMEYFRQTGRPSSYANLRCWLPLDGTRSDEPDKSGRCVAGVVTSPAGFSAGPGLRLPRRPQMTSRLAKARR